MDALGERHVIAALNRLFQDHRNRQALPRNLRGGGFRDLHQIIHGHDARDQPTGFGLCRLHHSARQAQIHRFGFANRAGQALRAANAGNNAQINLRLTELGRIRGDDKIAHHGDFTAPAQRIAADCRNDRLAEALNRAVIFLKPVLLERVEKRVVHHFFNVRARRKRFLIPGQDDTANVVVALQLGQRGGHFAHHGGV